MYTIKTTENVKAENIITINGVEFKVTDETAKQIHQLCLGFNLDKTTGKKSSSKKTSSSKSIEIKNPSKEIKFEVVKVDKVYFVQPQKGCCDRCDLRRISNLWKKPYKPVSKRGAGLKDFGFACKTKAEADKLALNVYTFSVEERKEFTDYYKA